MPISSTHPEYDKHIDQWTRCRDVFDGSDAVKEKKGIYLPRPGGMGNREFNAYIHRAMFYDIFSRVVDCCVGAVGRKPMKLEGPEAFEEAMEDATANGINLQEFCNSLLRELLITGRVGVMTDWSDDVQRPFLTYYRAEQIINWFADGSVVLEESCYESPVGDPFLVKSIMQWRHLSMQDGVFTVTIYRKREKILTNGDEYYVHEQFVPVNRGQPLKKIPFSMISPNSASQCIEKPPLLGFVDVLLSHYNTSADLEHGRHFTALPTLYITGATPSPDNPIHLGGTAAIILQDPQAKVGFAEFSGAGLGSLEKGLQQKEVALAQLGAGMFSGSKAGVEAAETARIRASSEGALLSGIVTATQDAMNCILPIMSEWMRLGEDVSVTINKDFIDSRLDAASVTALVKAYIAGAIRLEDFLFNLEAGEMLPDMDIEEIAEDIRKRDAENADLAAAKLSAVKTLDN